MADRTLDLAALLTELLEAALSVDRGPPQAAMLSSLRCLQRALGPVFLGLSLREQPSSFGQSVALDPAGAELRLRPPPGAGNLELIAWGQASLPDEKQWHAETLTLDHGFGALVVGGAVPMEMLAAVARPLSVIADAALRGALARRQSHRFEVLSRLSDVVSGALDVDALMQRTADVVRELLACEFVGVGLLDESAEVVLRAVRDHPAAHLGGMPAR